MQLATVPAPAQAPRRAEVPAHRDPNKDPGDFAPTNKNLRACFVCRLLKTEVQFYESGCDNCEEFLELAGDREKVQAYTTTSFSGLMSVLDPTTSWATKWLHLGKNIPGCYAMSVNEEPPQDLVEELQARNVKIHRPPS